MWEWGRVRKANPATKLDRQDVVNNRGEEMAR